jgi:hypothetical protein
MASPIVTSANCQRAVDRGAPPMRNNVFGANAALNFVAAQD